MDLLASLTNDLSQIANNAMDKIVDFGILAGKLQTPVKKGALRNSIRASQKTETVKTIEQDINWGNIEAPNDDGELVGVDYQAFVALGTSRQTANPFHIRTAQDINDNLNRIVNS